MDVRMRRPIVVGVDGSNPSAQGRAVGGTGGPSTQRALRVGQAVDRSTPPHRWPDPGSGPDLHEIRRRAARAHVRHAVRAAAEEAPDIVVDEDVIDGFPVAQLVEQSVTAQLVVVGSHGRGAVGSLLLGSVGNAVLHRADCPVVVRGAVNGEA